MIKDVFERSDGTYGYRRIQVVLVRRGVRADGSTIRDKQPDLLRRDFTADKPGKKLYGDITYVGAWAGFVCLATVLDCCTTKVVCYEVADHARTSLVFQAIDMAVRR